MFAKYELSLPIGSNTVARYGASYVHQHKDSFSIKFEHRHSPGLDPHLRLAHLLQLYTHDPP